MVCMVMKGGAFGARKSMTNDGGHTYSKALNWESKESELS